MNFTIRWTNRSHNNYRQTWIIDNLDSFELDHDYTRPADINVTHDHSFIISVNVLENTFLTAAATLRFDAANQIWSLDSPTPEEFELVTENNTVRVICFL